MGWLRAVMIVVVLISGGGYAWLQTPSYSMYQIQQSLKTRDFETFRRYVDIDSIVSHVLSEVGADVFSGTRQPSSPAQDGLAGVLERGLQRLVENVHDIAQATAQFALQRAFEDPDQRLPDIPTLAVVGALLAGETRDGVRYLPVTLDSGKKIEIGLRATPAGVWQVVRVTPVKALLNELHRLHSS